MYNIPAMKKQKQQAKGYLSTKRIQDVNFDNLEQLVVLNWKSNDGPFETHVLVFTKVWYVAQSETKAMCFQNTSTKI